MMKKNVLKAKKDMLYLESKVECFNVTSIINNNYLIFNDKIIHRFYLKNKINLIIVSIPIFAPKFRKKKKQID